MERLPHVLVVDDDPEVRAALRRVLSSAGFEVVSASSGAEALEAIRSGKYIDVMLTDLEMPGMHGTELIRTVRTIDAHLPIIVLTGHRTPGWVPDGASTCFDKPADMGTVIEALRSATVAHSGYVRIRDRGVAKG